MTQYGTHLVVDRKAYNEGKIVESDPPVADDLGDLQVLLRIEKFAYTANNVTYALVGDQIGYWKFFPVEETGKGIIPCWGFARVEHSKHPEIKAGSRYYGFFPMATHLIVTPGAVRKDRFTDFSTPRQGLPVIYNQCILCETDPLYHPEHEELQSLIRPLFTTSFLIHDQFELNEFYGAKQLILISASSKTGIGLASCLVNEDIHVVGVTSERNVPLVEKTGYYDEVVTYNEIEKITRQKSALVDFAGNHSTQLAIQQHLENEVTYNCVVGMVRFESDKGKPVLPVRAKFFFAPTYAARRIKELGPVEFGKRLAEKYHQFIQDAQSWIDIKHHKGGNNLLQLHQEMVSGQLSAREGHIVQL